MNPISRTRDDLPKSKYYLLVVFDVCFDKEHFIKSYKKIGEGDKAQGEKWFCYVEYSSASSRYNNQAYCDTLQKPVIEEFIKITHERYKECIGKDFGGVVPAIFTDEPNFASKKKLMFSDDKRGIVLPYTNDFDDTYKALYGDSIVDHIPELVWELPEGKISVHRYRYHDHTAERFASAFADTVGEWCKKNDILMTGHMLNEPSLYSQTCSVGDAMRSYRGFGLPGIDMLADLREYTTAKQAQSAAHQYGCPGVLSELYGVTNWTFDFRGHKLQGDWQAALGITVRVPHLFWVSMGGEAKRDYPASIGYQSPWYKEYKYVEDHFARVNTLMTRGTPDVNVAVIHPVESYWLHWGANDKTELHRDDMEVRFKEITKWLLFGNLDFDFVCESLLPAQFDENGRDFTVGQMSYKTVVVPYCEMLRSTTLDALKKFRAKGGHVIFMGEPPVYIDAVPSDEGKKFAEECDMIPWSRGRLYSELEPYRNIDIRNLNGSYPDDIIYQSRIDGDTRSVFIAHADKPSNPDNCGYEKYFITFPGEVAVTEYDTLTGEIRPMGAVYSDRGTTIEWLCGACSSLLVSLKAGRNEKKNVAVKTEVSDEKLSGRVDYELSEPNVLLLDTPAFSVNGGEKHLPEYILFADNDIREELGIRKRGGSMPQPWLVPYDKNPKEHVALYYEFDSDISVKDCKLALESVQYAQIYLNGEKVEMKTDGYYVDSDSIMTVPLPEIKKGRNEIRVEYLFGDITQLEAMYLLGSFGVELDGSYYKLIPAREKLGYDDICQQGLPFYGGNVTYVTDFDVCGGGMKTLEINKYRGSVITAELDGKRVGVIAYPPYRLPLGELADGRHELKITLFGNRMNTFGAIHHANEKLSYCSPGAWRQQGRMGTNEYLVRETGILASPIIITEK